MKKYVFHLIGVVLGISSITFGYISNDPSFYVLGFMFVLAPIFFNLKSLIKVPKIKIAPIKKSKKPNIKIKTNNFLRIFLLFTILFTVLISIVGMFFLPSFENSKFGLLMYYVQIGQYLIQHWIIFLILLFIFSFISQISVNKKKRFSVKLNTSNFLALISSIFSSYIISLLLILVVSTVHVLLIGAVSTVNPGLVSITTNIDQIKEKIKSRSDIPTIIGSDNDSRVLIVEHSKLFVELSQFYKKNVLPVLPKFMFGIIKNPSSPIFLYQDYLVIKIIDKDAIQKISPLISKKIVQKYFDTKYIRDEPNVNVISRQDYLKYRDDQFNKQLAKIQLAIDEIRKQIRSVNSKISEAKSNISTLQSYIVQNTGYRDDEYNKCVSATYTYYGYYSNYTYRLNSDAYCNSLRNTRDAQNAGYQDSINQNSQNLKYYQSQASGLNESFSDLDNYMSLIEQSKSSTPYELGLFEPTDSVKVVLESTSNKAVGDYFATLTHEYLHYTSYVSEERSLPQFFEEGLTEYLSRNAIKDSLKINTNLGYPLITKIIEVLAGKIDKNILSQIYFTKDLNLLTSTLDNVYGKNFYKDSESFFTLIPYLPSEQALKFANNIMYRIDGPKLTEEVLYSTDSNFK